jgi:hypothetical protein
MSARYHSFKPWQAELFFGHRPIFAQGKLDEKI